VPATAAGSLDNVPKTGGTDMTVWWVLMTGPALMAAGLIAFDRFKKRSGDMLK
jgi:LPXTG-motif cell wall-anchored protein